MRDPKQKANPRSCNRYSPINPSALLKMMDSKNGLLPATNREERKILPCGMVPYVTGVGAILLFLTVFSSCSDSLTPPVSLLPRILSVCELVALIVDIGVIGGVEPEIPELGFAAVMPGTVPMVGVGEFPTIPAVLSTFEDCVAMEETEFDLDLVGLDAAALGAGEAKLAAAELGIRARLGAVIPVGVGTGEGCVDPDTPIDSEG